MSRLQGFVLSLIITGACAAPPPPPPPPEPLPEPIVVPPFPFSTVWTAAEDVELTTDSGIRTVERTFTRLDVVYRDSVGLRVTCGICLPEATGYVEFSDVVYEPETPAEAADDEIAEFALAIRDAALRRDLEALRPVMSPYFSYILSGGESSASALAFWENERYRSLDLLPFLLDEGLTTRDSTLWVAPPDFFADVHYSGHRAGVRKTSDGTWQWVFLIKG